MEQKSDGSPLGQRLRDLREQNGWSLREVAAKAGVNHGYLSQLERGEVTQPAPAMLHRLAKGYGEPFIVLMQWANYIAEESSAGQARLSSNQVRALKYLGDDVSDDELDAIKSILNVLRSKRQTFSSEAESLDSGLSRAVRTEIRNQSLRLLQRSDAIGVFPTQLDHILEIAGLVSAGEISLDDVARRRLRRKFGDLVDRALRRLHGAVHIQAREVWVQPDLHELKRRFVVAHEIGHDLLPWQHDVFAYLDDARRLSPEVRIGFEREANQAAIELLSQGDLLRQEADDSRLSTLLFSQLSARYGISIQAVSRRVVEESHQDAALAIRFRRSGYLGPYHLYSSQTFTKKFDWEAAPPQEAHLALRQASLTGEIVPFFTAGVREPAIEMDVDVLDIYYAVVALFVPSRRKRTLLRLPNSR